MPFDVHKFMEAKYKPRTKEVDVSKNLKAFFNENENPVFLVRNLTSDELSKAQNEAKNNRDLQKIAQTILSKNPNVVAESIKAIFETDDRVSDYVVKCFGYIEYGTVEPKLNFDVVKKIGTVSPTTFFDLAGTIYQLTGMGAELGE